MGKTPEAPLGQSLNLKRLAEPKEQRAARLAAALKSNLKRRKLQARERGRAENPHAEMPAPKTPKAPA